MIALLFAFSIFINGTPQPVRTLSTGTATLVELQPVIAGLHASLQPYQLTSGWQVTISTHTIILGTDTRQVVVDGELESLSQTPVQSDGSIFVPMDFVTKALCPLAMASCRQEGESLYLTTTITSRARLMEIQIHYLTGFSKVVFTFDHPPLFTMDTQGALTALAFDPPITPSTPAPHVNDPLVSSIAMTPKTITLHYTSASMKVSYYTLANPFRLVLDVSRKPEESTTLPENTPVLPRTGQPTRFTVVIDPGHGGKDEGAHNKSLVEKDLTLRVAKKVQTYLESTYGTRTVLTRNEDVTVPLDERTAKANEIGAQVFVSIHANSASIPTAHGAEVYYLTTKSVDDPMARLAMDENNGKARPGTVDVILWDLAQSASLNNSARLAEMTAKSIAAETGLPERGVKQAPFRVLMGASMPAILVELGFLTNAKDTALLSREEYLDAQAKGIAEAIHQFQISRGDRWLAK